MCKEFIFLSLNQASIKSLIYLELVESSNKLDKR